MAVARPLFAAFAALDLSSEATAGRNAPDALELARQMCLAALSGEQRTWAAG
jgi:hypothetical protein